VFGIVSRIEIGRAKRCGDQFRATLAVAVWVVAAHRFRFAIAPDPFAVFVALVTRHIDHSLDARHLADRIKEMDRAHDIGRVGLDRVGIRITHQRLRGHVDDDFGLCVSECLLQGRLVAHIANDRDHAIRDAGFFKQARRGVRCQRKTGDLRAHRLQPQRNPAAFETGMTRQKDALTLPKCAVHSHTFHGALPDCQSSSKWILSRSVSIGCQKPRWKKASS